MTIEDLRGRAGYLFLPLCYHGIYFIYNILIFKKFLKPLETSNKDTHNHTKKHPFSQVIFYG
jgi:hypothetical protein